MYFVNYQFNASDFGVLWAKTAALVFFKCPVVGPLCGLMRILGMLSEFALSGV
jgi:hypothetical protein